jgi:chaperone LolA
VQFGVTKAEQSFSGKLIMKKGNRYRIDLEGQTIVTDGKSVWSYNKANQQVLIDKYRENPQSFSPDMVLVNIPENYTPTVIGKESLSGHDVSIVKLTPKSSKPVLKCMKVWVDREDWLLRKVQVLELSDNLTTYTISDIRLNTNVADSQFRFDPPEGTETIDLR